MVMDTPVPVNLTDVDAEAEIVHEFNPADQAPRGYLQFFYHSAESPLPIRDVTGTHGHGRKLEPCIERKADNYCTECYQRNIDAFAGQDRRYLFLYTTCRYRDLPVYGDRFVVGYILKERVLSVNGRTAIQGPTKLVSFADACPLAEVAPWNLRGAKKLDTAATARVLDYLGPAENIYHDCVEAIERLEATVDRPRVWETTHQPRPAFVTLGNVSG